MRILNYNQRPTITNLSGDSLSYNEGAGAVVIEQGANALVADADSANFDTGTLTISIPSGGDSAEDVLSIRNQGTGAGQIGVSGSNVTYGGVTIGTFTGGSNGSNLVITLNSSADATTVTALVKNITYENTDAASPTTGARTVRYVLTDGDGATSANYDATVTVTAVNDAPVLALGATNLLTNGSFESGATGWTGNTGVEVNNLLGQYGVPAPPDGTYFVEVEGSNTPGAPSYIEQTFTTVVGQTYVVSLSAITRTDVNVQDRGAFSINGVEIGQFTTGTSWKDYAVSFTATSTSSTLQITSLGSLSGGAPLTSDGGGLVIDHVQVVTVQTAAAYTEGGSPVVLAGTARVFDAELSALDTFNGATLTLARNGGAAAEDVFSGSGTLSLTSGNVIVSGTTIGTYTNSGGTLQLTLNASATNTLVNSAMQQIAYSNSSDAPPASAQINWTFSDGNSGSQGSGGALTATGSTIVTITAINDAPTITSNGGGATASVSVAETEAAVTTVTSTDVDGGTAVYSILSAGSGGAADAAQFSIDSSTGALAFSLAPDFEAPTDSNGDNVYEVTVQVADGNGGFATQLIRVSVLDVANTLTVSTTADTNDSGITAGTPAHTVEWLNAHQGADGLISLREAIIAANNTPGLNVIGFGIAGTGTHTILVTAALPTITDAVVIDATTDDSVAANGNRPAIALDGGHSVAGSGLVLSASADGSTIRGLIIRGFNSHGIQIEAGSSGNTIAGNYIGSLDFNGANAGAGAQNLGEGIAVFGDNNIIGGVTAADRNIISGNAYAGISVSGEAADGNQILGNYIGLDAAGTGAIGNRSGIWVSGGADATLIGGTTAAHRNVIAVTVNEGIGIVDTGTNDTIVQGNYIGTDATGTAAMGTGRSAVTAAGGTGTVIGGDTVGAGNVIANSAADGVRVYNTGTSASILGNAIYNNAQEGIDVRNDGVSLNDGALLAGEPNLMMDFPVFTESSVSGSTLTVAGYIGVNPLGDTDFAGARVEMFLSSNDGAYGEGQVFLGFLTADANGRFSGTLTLTTAVQVGDHLTATATSTTNQTSEFCANVAVIAGNGAPVNTVSGAQSVAEDTTLALSGISVADVAGNLSTVQLAVGNGRLDVTLSGGATISAGGNGTNTLTLSGSQAAINATLASLNYQGTLNFTGSDTLTMTSTDSNAATDMDTVAITVTAVNDAPTDLVLSANTVAENAANGTVVGTVTGTDPDTGDTKTYSFTDNAGGRFAINSSTGEITVADGSLLNYEATTSHGVTVRVTDSGNLTYDETFTINLTNVNEAPLGADTTVTITEDTSHTLTTANFGFSDVDAGDSLSAVRVDTLPGAGSLTLSGVAVTAGQVVIVADITAGNLVFAPAADANGTGYASLTFSVRDANNAYDSTPNTLTIDVTAVNDAPTIVINNGSTVAEGGTDTITGAELAASDVDNSDSQLAFSVGTGPAHGRIELTTAPGLSATSFTQADIVANRLVYVHDGSETLSDSFTFALSDGAGGSVGATTVTLTIAPVNDAPTITSGGGGATASINVAENVTGITMVVGADVDLPAQALTYGISGGIDQALFTIDATTGALSFVAPRNFEVATDANGDNVYVVQVRVTDTQGGAVTQTIQVTVTDVAEGLPPAPVAPVLPPSLIPMPPPSVVTPAPQTQALPASQGSQESMSALKAPTRGIPTEQRFIAERAGVKSSMTAPRTDDGSGGDERLKGRLVSRPDEGETQNPFVIMPVELVASDDPAGPEPPLSISEVLMTKLDEVARSLQEAAGVEQEQQAFVAHVTAVTGMTLSVGFVAWAIRSGSLLASCLTTIPAWRTFDPLPVVSLSRRERARWWEHTDASMQAEDVEFEGLQDLFDAPPSPASPSDPSKESGSSGTGGV
ncbi:MAG: cadherin-like domain-containing protein [Nitrospira sp.]